LKIDEELDRLSKDTEIEEEKREKIKTVYESQN